MKIKALLYIIHNTLGETDKPWLSCLSYNCFEENVSYNQFNMIKTPKLNLEAILIRDCVDLEL